VSLGGPHGVECDLRAGYALSSDRHAFHAACLADVLHAFCRHFLQLAVSEASSPVLRVISGDQNAATSRRAA
jgi:hypothetical protein